MSRPLFSNPNAQGQGSRIGATPAIHISTIHRRGEEKERRKKIDR
jgi:hypothetical protein